jgi:small ligand-binding sensory domain FIST
MLRPGSLIGATAVSVLGGNREVEDEPAVVVWAARFDEPVVPVRVEAHRTDTGWVLGGMPEEAADGARTLVLVPDPFTFPSDSFVAWAAARYPELTVAGGMASAARGPGANRLALDGAIHADGAVGALLPPGVTVTPVVSQGCRPIGDPMIVTRSERNMLYELAGRTALDRLVEVIEGLGPDDRELARDGLHIGVVVDERQATFDRGDFLVRNVVGVDRDAGSLAVGAEVEVGSTVQFHVRDAATADEDLRSLLGGRRAAGALVFTCNGRGVRLFGTPDHDAEVVNAIVDGGATAGMFCAGELGRVGTRSFVHGFTASVLLFQSPL